MYDPSSSSSSSQEQQQHEPQQQGQEQQQQQQHGSYAYGSSSSIQIVHSTIHKTFENLKNKEQREPIFYLTLWMTWLLIGSLYYGYSSDFQQPHLGFIKGYYMAINIGYSIGFGYPLDVNTNSIWFSTVFVLIGSSFVGVALGFFADKITQDNEQWFTRLSNQKKIEDLILLDIDSQRSNSTHCTGNASTCSGRWKRLWTFCCCCFQKKRPWKQKLRAWMYHQRAAIRAVSLWLIMVSSLIVVSMIGIESWTFREAQYFAISSLSTGGHWAIPQDSPTWLYGITGALTMIGVPVMGMAMAAVGQSIMTNRQQSLEGAKSTIDAPVVKEELQILEDLGLEDGDGQIDLAEFIVLCMVRVGTDPGLLSYIKERFKTLSSMEEENNNGRKVDTLTVQEITQETCCYVNGKVRRKTSLDGSVGSLGGGSSSFIRRRRPSTSNDNNTPNQDSVLNFNGSSSLLFDPITHHTDAPPQENNDDEEMMYNEGMRQSTSKQTIDDGDNNNNNNDAWALKVLAENTVIQPLILDDDSDNNNDDDGKNNGAAVVRSLNADDDLGMALLDRSYRMSMNEERQLLEVARGKMKKVLKGSNDRVGWEGHGRIAGAKIMSKKVGGTNNNGSPFKMIKSVIEIPEDEKGKIPPLDFWASQFRYYFRSEDAFNRYYSSIDPLMIQTAQVTRIRHRELLNEDEREECVIMWIAIKGLLGMADRDFAIVNHSRRTRCPISGDPVVATNIFSIKHPAVPDMEHTLKRIRAVINLGGYIIRPHHPKKSGGSGGGFTITYVVQFDPKGSLPIKVANTISLSQGLNASKQLELGQRLYRKALILNNATTPVECRDLKRRGSAVHKLQLIRLKELDDTMEVPPVPNAAQQFKFQICVVADHPMTIQIDDVLSSSFYFSSGETGNDGGVSRRLAEGKAILFGKSGRNGLCVFKTTLILTVLEGTIPKVIVLRLKNNSGWKRNKVYLPALAQLCPVRLSSAHAASTTSDLSSIRLVGRQKESSRTSTTKSLLPTFQSINPPSSDVTETRTKPKRPRTLFHARRAPKDKTPK